MQDGGFFYYAFVYLAAAVVSVPIAKKLGLSSVLGYLIAGVLIGPFVFGFVGEEGQDVMHFAEFGVVMMLFLIGLELQPAMFWKLKGPIFGLGGLQVSVTALAIMGIAVFVGLPWQTALAIGLTLALSSTAIVLQSLKEKGLMPTDGGQNAFSVLLFQDIAVIPILAILPLLAVSSGSHSTDASHHAAPTLVDGLPIWGQTLAMLAVVATIILVGRYLMSHAFRLIAKTRLRELFTAAALLLVIAVALLMTQVGVSPALGTFVAGVVLAQSEYRHELETNIEPFKGLLLGLFFIAVGASIDFHLIAANPGLISILVCGLVVLKLIILFLLGKIFKIGLDNNLLFTFSLAQGGEFAFVLFSFALQNHVIDISIINPLIAVVALTMAVTPLLMMVNEKLILPRVGTKKLGDREADKIDDKNRVIIAGFGRMGSTIGRFLQANGVQATYLDDDADNVDLLRKLGLKVYYGDAARNDLLRAAGAEEAELLIIAMAEPERTLKIVETAQKNYPHLKIMARTAWLYDAYELFDLGVEDIYRENLDTALRLAADALVKLGYRANRVYRAAKTFRRHDEKYMRELAHTQHDQHELIRETKQRIEDLEQIMLDEIENIGKDKDLGWDASTLIEEFGKKSQNS